MTSAIRIVLTAAVLVVVWLHAHWSVALCLSLLSIETELRYLKRRLISKPERRAIREVDEATR